MELCPAAYRTHMLSSLHVTPVLPGPAAVLLLAQGFSEWCARALCMAQLLCRLCYLLELAPPLTILSPSIGANFGHYSSLPKASLPKSVIQLHLQLLRPGQIDTTPGSSLFPTGCTCSPSPSSSPPSLYDAPYQSCHLLRCFPLFVYSPEFFARDAAGPLPLCGASPGVTNVVLVAPLGVSPL